MPITKSDYGPDWDKIALEVKEAAGWRCEWCGVPHKSVIRRENGITIIGITSVTNSLNEKELTEKMPWPRLKFFGLTRVILTTAHLDRDCTNHDRRNLAALCQRCHLRHDIRQHIANRKYGRRHAKGHQLKLKL